MSALEKAPRALLKNTVEEARGIAEKASRAALEELAVNQRKRPDWLSEKANKLRLALRAHGRLLGDCLNGAREQTMERLLEEAAYGHWHRMIFSRFLAENGLLLYSDAADPDNATPLSIADCMELAADAAVAAEWRVENGWQLAARLAARQLPQIFNVDSPLFGLDFAPEYQQGLERLLAALPAEIFTADDSLGWLYQFWQNEAKKRVNDSGVKIGARELPAVTQLFTEAYMVDFLLDNSLGAWLAARRLTEEDLKNAQDEAELRRKASIPGVPLKYLRFAKNLSGWRIAAGAFAEWPDKLADFRLLDPCCGSGHFLVSALRMLGAMRMELESLEPKEALSQVLAHNLFGLELDLRCVQLAAFALAFAAWTFIPPGSARPPGVFRLPKLNIACSGLAVSADKAKWTALAPPNSQLRNALDLLHDEFKNAPSLGSLIEPENARVEPEELRGALAQALAGEGADADELRETAVAAAGIGLAAEILARKYTLVATNVPYLGTRKQDELIKAFCEQKYPRAKTDLATVFLERCLKLCEQGGSCALVLPQNWLFQDAYKSLRKELLKRKTWNVIARLGSKGFQTPMWDFNVQLLIISNLQPSQEHPFLFENTPIHLFSGLDVSVLPNAAQKAQGLVEAEIVELEQQKQLENPDSRVAFGEMAQDLLNKYADSYQGVSPADFPRYGRNFWEMPCLDSSWCYWQSTTNETKFYSGRSLCLWLREVELKAENEGTAFIRGRQTWGKDSIVISAMGNLLATLGKGAPSDTNVGLIVPENYSHLPAIWCFCSSSEYNKAIRRLDQKLNVTSGTLVKVPFDLERWSRVAAEEYPNGLPKPFSDDLTQWIFHGQPAKSVIWDEAAKRTAYGPLRFGADVLQVAVARLLGYQWPAEKDAEMELCEEQRALASECSALARFADRDGIVCIPAFGGAQAADERLKDLLAAAYGEEWSTGVLERLLAEAAFTGKGLEAWLRDGFFVAHCKLFQDKPFIWQVWDGLADGFSALLNYHRLDYKNLEKLAHSYLGGWIRRQQQDKAAGVPGAAEKLAAAQNLQRRLMDILEGEAPLDIFVRWKPLAVQPIGWNPDLNDGVRLNIRPFMAGPDIGKAKGAGILRARPNISWKKDRGRDHESAPWHDLFHGDRINDWHLSLEEKREARLIR